MPDLKLKRWLWAVCAGMLLVPCAANAAGLGRLTILSGLGQPLNAEIELVSPQKGETLTARLSPIELYQQANLPYNPALVGARVSVERRANGQPYVKVVTPSNVSEPFAELLIELNSESGRITRQYTLLLDPPGYGRSASELAPPAPAVVDAPASRPAAPVQSARAPAAREEAASTGAAPNAAVDGGVTQGAPVRGSTPITKPAPQAAASEAQAGGAKQYGPIKPGETLGRIARAVRPEGVTLEQTLVGLYRQNPDAFIKKNMNLVKSGRILKVPEAAELTALAQRDAVREVRLQSADFESFRNRVADRAGTAPEDGGVASGRIGARIAGREAPEPRDTVRVSRGEPSAQAAGAKGGPERMRTLEEEAVAREKALADANERVAQLEKTIKDMQRLADLKKPGAAAQPQAGPATSASMTSPTSTSSSPRPAASATATGATPATVAAPAPPTPAAPPPATTPPTPSTTTPTLSLDTQPLPGPLALTPPQSTPAAAGSGTTSVAANSAPLDVHKAPSPIPLESVSTAVPTKSPVAVAPAARPDLLTQILREPLYLAAGGIVLLGGLLVAMRRRRSSRAHAFKAETAEPGPRSGGHDLSTRLVQAEAASTQKKAEPSLASTAAPVVAAPTAAIASEERPTPMPAPSATEAVDPTATAPSSAAEDNDLDFQAAAPVAEAKVTPTSTAPEAGSVTPIAPPSRATESATSVIERAMGDAPASDTPPDATRSGVTLAASEPRVKQPADFGDKGDSSSALPLPALNLPIEVPESAPQSKQAEAVPDLEFTLPDVNLDGNNKTAPAGAVKDGHWQDVQQKFDLAKAYQEMGDKDGARSILEEVIKEGDTTQQVQARRVLGLLN